ncbi:MAG: DMT family transporter [Opitutales bacterium]|nr:DMT family transporter [Opitutales bacterium]
MIVAYIALIIRIISNPLANVLQKKIVQDGMSASSTNALSYLLLAFVSFPILLRFDGINIDFITLCAISGFFGSLSNFFLVRALELSELSVVGPINSYKAVVGMVFAVFLINEYPDLYGIIGVLLIIAGNYFIIDFQHGFSFKLFFQKGIRYRFYALFLAAIEAVLLKKIIMESTADVGFAAWACFGALFSLPIMFIFKSNKNTQVSTIQIVVKIIVISILMGCMQLSTNFVFEYIEVGYALALFQLSSVLSVLFGMIFFNENNIVRKLLGVVVMVVGTCFIVV